MNRFYRCKYCPNFVQWIPAMGAFFHVWDDTHDCFTHQATPADAGHPSTSGG